MRRIGVLYNPLSENSVRLSGEVASWLQSQGFEVWRGHSQEGREDPRMIEGEELMIALGGDGTILRAARLAIPHRIPILAVALGRLSFMAEIGPEELPSGLQALLAGGGWRDARALLHTVLRRDGRVLAEYTALNEVVLSRSDVSRVLNVDVQVDGAPLTTYHADGVLVATATGSTAYALAAGGPIVDPRSKALLLVSVAAHLTSVPSMVLHEDTVITLHLKSRHHASLAIDGRENIPLQAGDEVEVRRSSQVCIFARIQPPSQFYARLVRRLRRE
ncbi:MAG: NAD(+)/NADH kinase [Chloroflexaceae bacterium]|jgi:NAD+ kinase|nr:NAD(+)/NADH kinase [Chloroflexaceae bacterium]